MIKPYEEYQVPAVQQIHRALFSTGRALVAMATGLGKTIVSAFSVQGSPLKGRTLFLCHNNSILEQAMKEFRLVLGDSVRMGVFHGEKKHWDEVDILFASLQTMRGWKQAFFKDEFFRVIVDESHHSQAHTFKRVIQYFKPQELVGLTGTPDRADERDIREIFGIEVVRIPLEEGIAKGWLAQVEYNLITDNLDQPALTKLLGEVQEGKKRISLKQLNTSVFIKARDERAAEKILSYGRKKTIVFCEGVTHANNFQQFLPNSLVYHTGVSSAANKETLEDFRSGKFDHILVVDKMNEGVDVPDAEILVFLRSTGSKTIFLQQLGRGVRKTSTKRKVIVLDFVANVDRVVMIREMVKAIQGFAPERQDPQEDPIHVRGDSFEFVFSSEQIDLFKLLERLRPRYVSDIPELAADYSTKNPLPANRVISGTRQSLSWRCSKCGKEFEQTGAYRMKMLAIGYTHKHCKRIKQTLFDSTPHLITEYMDKNSVPVGEVSPWSSKKFWWKCSRCNHEWEAKMVERARREQTGCPVCARQLASESYNLKTEFPLVAEEYSEENSLPATKVTPFSGLKYWWKCKVCGHKWKAACGNRTRHGTGCPKCFGKHPLPKAQVTSRKIARQRGNLKDHPTLCAMYSSRNSKPVSKMSVGSHERCWWKCEHCQHEWQLLPRFLAANGGKCPSCKKTNRSRTTI